MNDRAEAASDKIRTIVWLLLARIAAAYFGPGWLKMLRPPPGLLLDFSQEWLSSRNFYAGKPIYRPQVEALFEHTGFIPNRKEDMLPWNAHPPCAVLLALPFAKLDYPSAHLAWNIMMLGSFGLALCLVFPWGIRPWKALDWFKLIALALACHPLLAQFIQGQLNALLALLIIGAWRLDRAERPAMAGVCIGLAAALKIFPAFLFVYWAMRMRWSAVVGGVIAFLIANGSALALFGSDAFATYLRLVLPSLDFRRSDWGNVSLPAFWLRLFNPDEAVRVVPFAKAPLLGAILAYGSQVLIAVVVALRCRQVQTAEGRTRAFALAIIGMLLITPIVWTHYFIILLLPVVLFGSRVQQPIARPVLLTAYAIFWLPLGLFLLLPMGSGAMTGWESKRHALPPAQPWQSLAGLSVPTYALLAFFAIAWWATRDERPMANLTHEPTA